MENINIEPIKKIHLNRILKLFKMENWPFFHENPDKTWKALSNNGVITLVAILDNNVIGFVTVLIDWDIVGYLPTIIIDKNHRRKGIGKILVKEAFLRSGANRMNLLSDKDQFPFYESFKNQKIEGFRIYP